MHWKWSVMLMQLGIVLLVCIIILSLTDVLEGLLRYLSINKWVLFALFVFIIIANQFPIKLFTEFIINPAAILAVILLSSMCSGSGFMLTAASVVCAVLSSVIISFIKFGCYKRHMDFSCHHAAAYFP